MDSSKLNSCSGTPSSMFVTLVIPCWMRDHPCSNTIMPSIFDYGWQKRKPCLDKPLKNTTIFAPPRALHTRSVPVIRYTKSNAARPPTTALCPQMATIFNNRCLDKDRVDMPMRSCAPTSVDWLFAARSQLH